MKVNKCELQCPDLERVEGALQGAREGVDGENERGFRIVHFGVLGGRLGGLQHENMTRERRAIGARNLGFGGMLCGGHDAGSVMQGRRVAHCVMKQRR